MRDMNRFDRDALDRHITGNWGEDFFFEHEPEEEDFSDIHLPEPVPPPRCPWCGGQHHSISCE